MSEHKKVAISSTHDCFLREVDKIGLISMNIAMHVIQGRHNRSGRPGDRQTNACCTLPKKPADVISEVLSSENCLCFARKTDCFKTLDRHNNASLPGIM